MKKIFLYPMMALFMMLFAASCSQEEILSDSNKGEMVTMNVNVPVNNGAGTRALPSVADHKLRCIMQVINSQTKEVIETKKQEVTVENFSFTFEKPKVAYNVLFWADFVSSIDEDYIYDTASLQTIDYKKTDNTLFNNDAADAFCGKALNGEVSVTLKRPFAKIKIKPSTTEGYANFTKVTTTYQTPSKYDILTGEIKEWKEVKLTDGEIKDGVWFSAFVFASNNTANLAGESGSQKINVTLKDNAGTTNNVNIDGEDISTAGNTNATVNVTPTEGGKNMEIEITFEDEFTDPNALKVGDFIYADGSHKSNNNDGTAIGIVFKVGQYDGDNATEYSGKTIAGYAASLTFTKRLSFPTNTTSNDFPALSEATTAPWTAFNGLEQTNTLLGFLTGQKYISQLLNSDNENSFNIICSTTNSIENFSQWYIPSFAQLCDIIGGAVGYGIMDANFDKGTPALDAKTAITELAALKEVFKRATHTGAYNYVSSSFSGVSQVCGIQFSAYNAETGPVVSKVAAANTVSGMGFIIPIRTVYKK